MKKYYAGRLSDLVTVNFSPKSRLHRVLANTNEISREQSLILREHRHRRHR